MSRGETRRPPNGYRLSLYDDLRRDIPWLRESLGHYRACVERDHQIIADYEQRLIDAEGTLAWMIEHQADEIAELEAYRDKVRAMLRAGRGGKEKDV
jgi:hypothetical protein